MPLNLYIGRDNYKDRGYFCRETSGNGPGPLLNHKFEYINRPDDKESADYYFTAEQLGAYLRRADISFIQISLQIEPHIIKYFEECLRNWEPAKESFEIGGAL